MARSTNNVVTHGLSGKVDMLVFSQRNGRTFVSKRPRRLAAASSAQQGIRSTFQQAVMYAKTVLANEAVRVLYTNKARPGQTAYNMAIADFFRAPLVGDIDISRYTGQAGDTIAIAASDDFTVAAVKVKIESGGRSIVEEGDAVLQGDGVSWLYTTTQSVGSLPGSSITVTAIDLPGHSSVKQKMV